ncbi:KGK domain-containing protein [Chamaesiphon sp. VAR_69_metabat_338]|uniref:KGK domain-containing protein n=1 Tax=Chamaesiphon sp. VAR_69_metabat_338 TaxID=2964704 RepID=UPI00286E604E|nr:KGK domain-containing protein [Chamaesiphon sp. VAR_69_metabat_338]
MQDRFESLESGEVISVQNDTQVLSGHRTFRVGELNESLENHLKSAIANWNEAHNGWFKPEGVECEALRFGSQGWQKGRIRLCLEFCPDEPTKTAQGTSATSIPMAGTPASVGQAIAPPVPHNVAVTTPDTHPSNVASAANPVASLPIEPIATESHPNAVASLPVEPVAINSNPANPLAAAVIPAAGIAAVGAVAAAAMTPADLHPTDTHQLIPHFAETTLEQEDHYSEPSIQHSIDEIAYDFSNSEAERVSATPNGMMELDLADLGLDFSDSDLLGFETGSITENSEEFLNLSDRSKPENSGMLIDEVWNEMNQGNWPGIN